VRTGFSRFLRVLPLCLAFVATPALATSAADFQAARAAFQKGQSDRAERLAAKFGASHVLAPYFDYWRLKAMPAPSPQRLRDFIARNPDTPLANVARADLARLHARDRDWPAFREQFRAIVRPDQELRCHDLHARLLTQADADAGREALETWRGARDLPSACDAVFELLAERGLLTLEDRYLRLRLAFDLGNPRLAREIDARLPAGERMSADALTLVERDPAKLVATAAASNRRAQREAALYALGQIAKSDSTRAARLWESHVGAYTESEQRHGWGQIGLYAARRHEADALTWLTRAGAQPTSTEQLVWRARAALRAGRWDHVHHAIQNMPEAMREEAVWRYWKARALKAMNATYQANVLFANLSREHHYYGLLAAEELPATLEARPLLYKVTPDDLKAAESHPGLRRALALRDLGEPANAIEEWNWALRGMDDRQLLAAAELALRARWHDRAIVTAERTRELHDFDLRYIAPFRDLASAWAEEHGLDEAWVYGLMRQESRFVEVARSRVGAQGLMQIMPATAKWIARQMGLGKNAHAGVDNPDTNIRFGTFYLRHVFDSLGQSPVLATAGYNAGPGRARRWQAEAPLEGAIYVESIPFPETREYVKKVLANAMFYRARFGGIAQPLKERLGVIPAHPSRRAAAPDAAEAAAEAAREG